MNPPVEPQEQQEAPYYLTTPLPDWFYERLHTEFHKTKGVIAAETGLLPELSAEVCGFLDPNDLPEGIIDRYHEKRREFHRWYFPAAKPCPYIGLGALCVWVRFLLYRKPRQTLTPYI